LSASPAIIDNRRGIIAILLAMAFFITNDAIVKLASATFPTSQVMAVRGIFASLFALGLVFALRETKSLRRLASPLVALRATIEATVAFLFITALALLPLANVNAIMQATPIIMTLMSVAIGLERVGWRRWAAILAGFAGVLLIVQPSAEGFDIYALIALSAAFLVAIRDLVTRRIGDDIPSIVVAFSTTVAVSIAGFVIGFVRGDRWAPFFIMEMNYLLVTAVLVTFANLGIVIAFRNTDVSVVSPFRYIIVVFAIILGYLFFDELPDIFALMGIALIAGSGLYMIHRENRVRRQIARPSSGPGTPDGARP
jgi:drug/metabolite transporter (DMT)-like permease